MTQDDPRSDDPFAVFRRDHDRVLGRLARLETEFRSGRVPLDDGLLNELVAHLERQFATHMAAEDSVLYPALRAAFPGAASTIDPLLADHAELRAMLSALAEQLSRPRERARDEQVEVLVRDLSDLLRLHIHREESVVFDVAARVLSRAEIAALTVGLDTLMREPPESRAPQGH